MANLLQKQATVVFVPARVGVVGRAAYCYTETNVVKQVYGANKGSAFGMSGLIGSSGKGSAGGIVTLPPLPAGADENDPRAVLTGYTPSYVLSLGSRQQSGASLQTRYSTVQVQKCLPAIPSIPSIPAAQTVDNHFGWNAGARSLVGLDDDLSLSFRLPASPIGVICGLSDGSPGRSYSKATHAFIKLKNVVSIIEAGVVVADAVYLGEESDIRFEVRRIDNSVSYLVDGEQVYTSERLSGGRVYADATLYSPGDFVDEPVFEVFSSAGIAITNRLILTASDYPLNGISIRLPAPRLSLSSRAAVGIRCSAPVPILTAFDAPYSGVKIELPVPRISIGSSGPVIESAGIGIKLPQLTVESLILVGSLVSFAGVVPAPKMLAADRPYAAIGITWPKDGYETGVWENFDAPNETGQMDILLAADSWITDFPYVLVAMDSLGVGDTADIVVFADAEAVDFLGLSDTVSISGIMEMLVNSGLAVNDDVNSNRRTALQYAVNVLTGALTEYEGFDFTSFVRCGGETYGCRADGLYRLRGETDDGEYIRALVDLGTTDWGDPRLKRMDTAYVGIATDGEVYLRVAAGTGVERTYRVVGQDGMRRAVMAKGVSARQWSVGLEVVDATSVSLDLIELQVGVSQRQFRGRQP